jgi:hypothetical protein
MALRSKGLDQRYLSAKDRSDWKQSGGAARQQQAISKVRAWTGAVNWEKNRDKRTTLPKSLGKSHTGGFEMGIAAQQMRLQENSANLQRSKELRPEKYSTPDIYN